MKAVWRTAGRAVWRGGCVVALLSASPPVHLSAQVPDTTPPPPPPLVPTGAAGGPTDPTHRVRPMGAFLRPLPVPGWGQAVARRRVRAALLPTGEGVAALETTKAQRETHH